MPTAFVLTGSARGDTNREACSDCRSMTISSEHKDEQSSKYSGLKKYLYTCATLKKNYEFHDKDRSVTNKSVHNKENADLNDF